MELIMTFHWEWNVIIPTVTQSIIFQRGWLKMVETTGQITKKHQQTTNINQFPHIWSQTSPQTSLLITIKSL
jgi:hypothetical protein